MSTKKAKPGAGGLAFDPVALVEGLKLVAQSMTIIAVEKTKQAQIQANARVEIDRVHAMRDVLTTYLERSFDERAKSFAKLFENIDEAMASNDTEMAALHLDAVVKLAESSPFNALKDAVATRELLESKTEWKF